MKTITRLLCIAVILSIPLALLADERDGYRSGGFYYDRPSDRGDSRLSGSVRLTDKNGRTMQITVGGRNQKIRLGDGYRVFSGSRRMDLDDIRKGDSVSIEGYRSKGNEFIALTIYIGSRYDSRDDQRYDNRRYDDRRYGDSIQARVVRDTTILSRTLRVSNLGDRYRDTFDVNVLKDADVVKEGRRISVHEIRTGDVIDAQGSWSGSDFTAYYIHVSDNYERAYGETGDDRTIRGEVQKLDYRDMKFTLDTGPDKLKINGDRSRISSSGRDADFRDIREGDIVYVTGPLDGRSINAYTIEIGRGYRSSRDGYYR